MRHDPSPVLRPGQNAFTWARIDFRPPQRPPAWRRVGLATLLALGLGAAGRRRHCRRRGPGSPSTQGYAHFQFHDYARLTVIGVLIACAAWPVVARCCSAPRWLFGLRAIVVTLVLFVPDFYILSKGQPAKAVAVLLCMHVAIALVTYNLLVHLAPVPVPRTRRRVAPAHAGASSP